jgi:hypothetical protein
VTLRTNICISIASNSDELDVDVTLYRGLLPRQQEGKGTRIRRVTGMNFSENFHLEDREVTA